MTIYYDQLTWPEINDAVADKKIPIMAVGSVEQHGPHLPLNTDWLQAHRIVEEAARRSDGRLLVMPPMQYGYITHAMDFPGTITIHWQHFIDFCLDITKSLAYHGFKKMIIVNGHGSNETPLDLVGRRTNLETDMMLYLAPDTVKKEEAGNYPGRQTSKFTFGDLFGAAPVSTVGWTSAAGSNGTFGRADLGTAEKGQLVFEESAKQLLAFAQELDAMPHKPRIDHHKEPPTTPVPG